MKHIDNIYLLVLITSGFIPILVRIKNQAAANCIPISNDPEDD